MQRICPVPNVWNLTYQELDRYAAIKSVPRPPTPLILAGWNFSSDAEKMNRWEETVHWAKAYGAENIVDGIKDEDFYQVAELTSPKEWGWSTEPIPAAIRPSDPELENLLTVLQENWGTLAAGFAQQTAPIGFSGEKARALKVKLLSTESLPPWGTWGLEKGGLHSLKFVDKSIFTEFRKRINTIISPHKVDHINFFKMNYVSHKSNDEVDKHVYQSPLP